MEACLPAGRQRLGEVRMTYITHSFEETMQQGKEIGSRISSGDVLLLYGELGSGKTTLVKGIAQGLGVTEEITSPTFTLMNVYPIRSPKSEVRQLVHIDTYRLNDAQELLDIGVEDYLGAENTVCIIEWPEKIEKLLKGKIVKNICLKHTDEKTREIRVENF